MLKGLKIPKKECIFQTGYGPSGLPHIGTFGEVLRTTMVIKAFKYLSDIPTKLFVFSDDMDGLRKVPQNIPNQNLIKENLEKPLSLFLIHLENLRVFQSIIIISLLTF